MHHFLDFEKPISVLEGKIEELRNLSSGNGINIGFEVSKLEEQLEKELKKLMVSLLILTLVILQTNLLQMNFILTWLPLVVFQKNA